LTIEEASQLKKNIIAKKAKQRIVEKVILSQNKTITLNIDA
jgi:hypothetical protein